MVAEKLSYGLYRLGRYMAIGAFDVSK